MKFPARAVFFAAIALSALGAVSQELPPAELDAFIGGLKQFDPQWAGPSKKAHEQIGQFLKRENLGPDQKCRLLKEMYPYARRIGDAEAEAVWRQLAALPASPARKAAMLAVIGAMPFGAAEKTARAHADLFASKIAMCAHLAAAAVKAGEIPAAVRLAQEIRAEKVEGQKGDPRLAPLRGIVAAIAPVDFQAAKALQASAAELYGADAPYTFLPVFMQAAQRLQDRGAFEAELAQARRLEDPERRFEILLEAAGLLRAGGAQEAGAALLAELDKDADTDAKRLRLLQARVPGLPSYFEYGLPEKDVYQRWKAAILPVIALQEKLNTRKPGFLAGAAQYAGHAASAFTFGDYAFADDLLKKYFELEPEAFCDVQLELALYRGDRALAAGQIARALAARNTKPSETNYYAALLHFDKGGKMAGFDKAVFGNRAPAPEERLTILRRASHKFFRAYRYEVARMIENEIQQNMFIPFARPSYDVKFDRQAPQSADSWARSPHYADWGRMFTAFEVSGKMIDLNQKRDIERHLKGCDAPKPDPAYRTGLQVLCDVSGVHFYGRLADPQPQDFVLKKRTAGEVEFNLRPGRDADFHYTAFLKDLPEVNDPYEVEWALPSRKYKLGADYIRKDAALTPDGVAVHVFVPWQMVYTCLPLGGTTWGLGFGRHGTDAQGKSFSYTVCGARVQELERSLELRFQIAAGDLRELKRGLVVAAFTTYDTLRNDKNESLFLWSDPTIGDRDFYARDVAPLLAELDAAGQRVRDGLPDKDVDLFLGQHVPRWLEVRYIIQNLRAAHLHRAVKARIE